MLRITAVKKAPAEIILLVEGRLVGPWVAELETAVIGAGVVQAVCLSIAPRSVSSIQEGLNCSTGCWLGVWFCRPRLRLSRSFKHPSAGEPPVICRSDAGGGALIDLAFSERIGALPKLTNAIH